MGGHGGLNILPQKRWNVYNWDNRERVRRDEQEAARQQEQTQQVQRERDAETRIQKLRANRGRYHREGQGGEEEQHQDVVEKDEGDAPLASHDQLLYLFRDECGEDDRREGKRRRLDNRAKQQESDKKQVKDSWGQTKDEGDGVRLVGSNPCPWYMSATKAEELEDPEAEERHRRHGNKSSSSSSKKKKSVEELRAERLKREEAERARARSLLQGMPGSRKHYNSSYGNAR